MKLTKLASIFAFVLASSFAFAAAPGNISVGSVEGTVVVTAADGVKTKLVAGDMLKQNTRISTEKDSSAKIVLANGTVIFLKPGTTLDVAQFEQNNPSAVDGQDYASFKVEPEATAGSVTTVRVANGTAFFKVAKLLPGSKITVKTRLGDVAVKGTTFYVSVRATSVVAGCIDGVIEVTPAGRGALTLTAGKSVTISDTGTLSFERVSSLLSGEAADAFGRGEDDSVSSGGGSSGSDVDVTLPPADVVGPNPDRFPVNSASSL
ncbi:MAG: FecR domain-containing protein [Opitutales bacterium]|nr:FecR domain-containing protein [Opitutales bacterium]